MNSRDIAQFLHDLADGTVSDAIEIPNKEDNMASLMNSKTILDIAYRESGELLDKMEIVRRLRKRLFVDEGLAEYLKTSQKETIKGHLQLEFQRQANGVQAVTP